MKKHAEHFAVSWDQSDSEDTRQPSWTFQDYLDHMNVPGNQGGHLELLAMAQAYKVDIVVIPQRVDMEPCQLG